MMWIVLIIMFLFFLSVGGHERSEPASGVLSSSAKKRETHTATGVSVDAPAESEERIPTVPRPTAETPGVGVATGKAVELGRVGDGSLEQEEEQKNNRTMEALRAEALALVSKSRNVKLLYEYDGFLVFKDVTKRYGEYRFVNYNANRNYRLFFNKIYPKKTDTADALLEFNVQQPLDPRFDDEFKVITVVDDLGRDFRLKNFKLYRSDDIRFEDSYKRFFVKCLMGDRYYLNAHPILKENNMFGWVQDTDPVRVDKNTYPMDDTVLYDQDVRVYHLDAYEPIDVRKFFDYCKDEKFRAVVRQKFDEFDRHYPFFTVNSWVSHDSFKVQKLMAKRYMLSIIAYLNSCKEYFVCNFYDRSVLVKGEFDYMVRNYEIVGENVVKLHPDEGIAVYGQGGSIEFLDAPKTITLRNGEVI